MAVIGFDFSVKCGGINVVGNWCCFMEFSLGLEIFSLSPSPSSLPLPLSFLLMCLKAIAAAYCVTERA